MPAVGTGPLFVHEEPRRELALLVMLLLAGLMQATVTGSLGHLLRRLTAWLPSPMQRVLPSRRHCPPVTAEWMV